MIERKTYSSSDFERYHSGKMTSTEMHEIERLSLEDPFLADALEGFQFTTNATRDIAELNRKIKTKTYKRRKGFIINANSGWLRIAALLVLVAGGSLIFYMISSTHNSGKVVSSEMRSMKASDSAALSIKSDSLSGDLAGIEQNTSKIQDKNQKEPANNRNENEEKNIAINESRKKIIAEGRTIKEEADTKLAGKAETSIAMASMQKEKNDMNEISLNKKLMAAPKKVGADQTYSDSIGYLQSKSKSYENINSESPAENNNPSPAILAKEKSSEVKRLLAEANDKIDGQQILSGNSEFDDYLKMKLTPVIEKDIRQKGVVILSFEIDTTGKPRNVHIAYSSCHLCEDQAKSILGNGPSWVKNKTHQMVAIKFY